MKQFTCIKDLTVVHRYEGGVYRYKNGQVVSESDLIHQGIKPNPEYFKPLSKEVKYV